MKQNNLISSLCMLITYEIFLLFCFFSSSQRQSKELASAAKEQVEAVNPGTNVSVSKDQFDSTVTSLNIVCSDVFPCFGLSLRLSAMHFAFIKVKYMFIGFLQAVTWFHLHQYTKSLSILAPLFQKIEPLDEVYLRFLTSLLSFVKSVLLALSSQVACRQLRFKSASCCWMLRWLVMMLSNFR